MAKQRLLITGGTGLLGLNWACAMRDHFDIFLVAHQRECWLQGVHVVKTRLEDGDEFDRLVRDVKPALAVHAAGFSNVDACEADPAAATRINATLAGTVAAVLARNAIPLVHISTDHIFSGGRMNYTEDCPPEPINAYARTKLQGEQAVAAAHPAALIVRTNFFGWGTRQRKSFSDWLIDTLRAGQSLRAFEDVFVTPILIDRLALAVHALAGRGAAGIVNVAGDERVSKLDFAVCLAQAFGLPANLVIRSSVADVSLKAPRPHDMSLSNARARAMLGASLGTVTQYLQELRCQEDAGRHAELMDVLGDAPPGD